MSLLLRVGWGCRVIHDKIVRFLHCEQIQVDEIWGFIKKKQRNRKPGDNPEYGDVWTFVALDAESKIDPSYRVGKRTSELAGAFMVDLRSRIKNRIQLSSDMWEAYVDAVELGFGGKVDYGQIVKKYRYNKKSPERRYSPSRYVMGIKKKRVMGNPRKKNVSTSHVERQNHTLRMHCRRLARLTNAFSKKLENFEAAIAMHFAYYNFVKTHAALGCTPAMAAGITHTEWTIADLVEKIEG